MKYFELRCTIAIIYLLTLQSKLLLKQAKVPAVYTVLFSSLFTADVSDHA
jgi:hypothetical protein